MRSKRRARIDLVVSGHKARIDLGLSGHRARIDLGVSKRKARIDLGLSGHRARIDLGVSKRKARLHGRSLFLIVRLLVVWTDFRNRMRWAWFSVVKWHRARMDRGFSGHGARWWRDKINVFLSRLYNHHCILSPKQPDIVLIEVQGRHVTPGCSCDLLDLNTVWSKNNSYVVNLSHVCCHGPGMPVAGSVPVSRDLVKIIRETSRMERSGTLNEHLECIERRQCQAVEMYLRACALRLGKTM